MAKHEIWIEAESFSSLGGWVVDQQSMEVIHSSYIMAHGLGVPVEDAYTEFYAEAAGRYNIWALTRDWTRVWNVADSAGKFRILIDGRPTQHILGTLTEDWDWQLAGTVELSSGKHKISLHDMTGFNARCDAVYMTTAPEKPSKKIEDIDFLRRRLNWKEIEDSGEFELIVAGGGIAGICTALSAYRSGVNVLLLNDRGVLGGCNSSEIRVNMGGKINLPPFENIGNVVKEIAPVMGNPSLFDASYYEDDRKMHAFELHETDCKRLVKYGKIRIALNEHITEAEKVGNKISAVICTNTLSGKKTRFKAKLFSDCTGDAAVARLAGAQVMYGREAKEEFGESLAPKEHQNLVMGHSLRWYSERCEGAEFPDFDWNLKFNDQTFLNCLSGDWEQETGFRRNMVSEIEYIRDYGLRSILVNWSYQKNRSKNKDKFANYRLKWISPIGGKRESYRVIGDHILTQNDIENHTEYPDATACLTWSIDMHFPEPSNEETFGEAFRSFAYHRGIVKPYPVPYRCLYARDIENLFLGGRCISASHIAFSSARVMRTLGELGEVAGLAAAVCINEKALPREVYTKHLDKLKKRMKDGVGIPQAFECGIGDEESYHYKDLGWLHLHPFSCDSPSNMNKFKQGINALSLEHKYDLPNELK